MKKRYYTRVCANEECGDVAQVGYKPKGTELCRPCAIAKNKIKLALNPIGKRVEKRKTYTYFCHHCSSVRIGQKRNGILCGMCARRFKSKKHSKSYFDFNTMTYIVEDVTVRWFRICKTCADLGLDNAVVEVASKRNSGLKHCVKHKVMPKGKDRKRVNNYRKRTSTKSGVSSQAIERAKKINEEHRKNVAEVKVVIQRKTEEQLIEEFLNNNKPTIIQDKKDEYIGGKMNIRGEY